jgi:uncharacterized SAM-binding protein YcdF (DUF218 family)
MSVLFGEPQAKRGRARRALSCVVVGVAVMSAIWFARASLLRGAAEAWIVSDRLTTADAIAILGGGLETRPFAAADYYRAGLARKVLVADVRSSPSEKLGVQPRHAELNRSVLLKLGVPAERIETFGSAVSNTYEEALALRAWVSINHVAVVIVPTEMFSSRRVRWMLAQSLEGTGTRALVRVVEPLDYTRDNWWRHEQGVIAFQNEVVKYLYYRFRYRELPRDTSATS